MLREVVGGPVIDGVVWDIESWGVGSSNLLLESSKISLLFDLPSTLEITFIWVKVIIYNSVNILNGVGVSVSKSAWDPSLWIAIFMLLEISKIEGTLLPLLSSLSHGLSN